MPLSLKDDEIRREPLLSLPKVGDEDHSPEFTGTQALKTHVLLGEQSPGQDVIATQMSLGNGSDYQKMLADTDALRQIERQSDVLNTITKADPKSITPEVIDTIRGLSMMQLQSPDLSSIIEKKYAELYTNTAAASLDNDVLEDAQAENPEGTMQVLDNAEGLAFKQNYAQKVLDATQKAADSRTFLDKALDFGESLVPLLTTYQKYNAVQTGDFGTATLPGGNLQDQYSYMWSLPPEEFQATLDATVEDLKSRNIGTAVQWLQGLFSYGSNDSTLENVFAGIDVASVIPAGKLFKMGTAMKGALRSSTRAPSELPKITADLGKYAESATGKVVDDLGSDNFFNQNIRNIQELEDSVPSISSPEKLLNGNANIPQEAYNRLKEALLSRSDLVQKFLTGPNRVDRATPEELLTYKDQLFAQYVKDHPSIQKNVIDVEMQEADVGNVYTAKVIIGKRDGTLFESEKAADNYFKRWIGGTDDYQITQRGQGYQIEINRSVDETSFFDQKISTAQKTPETFADTFSGWWRSPNYTVSRENELARSTSVTSTETLNEIFSSLSEPFHRLSKNEYKELEDLMVVNRTKQEYYKDVSEFTDAFYTRFKKTPTENQIDSYLAYIQINDLDLVVRDLDWYKQKARMGFEDITQSFRITHDADHIESWKQDFEGKVVDRLPIGSRDQFSYSIVKNSEVSRPKSSRFITDREKAEIDTLLSKGYHVVQVVNQDVKIGDRFADFIVTNDFKRSRVGVKNVDRKPGGHKVHKYPYYIKQGRIAGDEDGFRYRGDNTLFNVKNEKEGRELLKLLEEARLKVKSNSRDAAQFIRDNLPISPKDFFSSVAAGDINIDVPFAVVKRGQRSIDTGAYQGIRNLRDATRNEHNLGSRITGRYGGERGEGDVDLIRSEGDTKFEIEPAPYLSPMDTLRVSSSNMISTAVMNDYAIKTNQDFLREFGNILVGTREEQMSSGISLLTSPEFKSGADPRRIARAKNVSRAFNNLMNTPTLLDRKIEVLKEKFLYSVAPKFGPRGENWADDKMLTRVRDPGAFLRSAAFNMKLGMFNVQQFFVQANQMVNVTALAGRNGLRGGLAYPLARLALLRSDEATLKRLSELAEKTGLMKAQEFREGISLLKKSGWNNVGNDVAYLDDIRSPEMKTGRVANGFKKFLTYGRTPFQEGERVGRISAFLAAYLEQKALLKGGKIGRREEAIILQRAKDLTGNMTRESNAAWQKGYGAVFTQFFGYQARLMEQMIGKKLSGAEKARLFTAYSMMYGTPVAVGSVVGVIPVRDIVKDTLAAQGVDTESNPALDVFMDGFTTQALQYIFGDEMNVSSRFGPGGLPTFYDLWRGDKDLNEVLMGASGSIALDTLTSSWPALRGMWSEFSDFDGGYYNLTPDDIVAPLRNITTVDSAYKLYQVYNAGIWFSKNGTPLTSVSLPEGVLGALTGLSPQSVEESYSKIRATKDYKEHQKSVQKEFIKEYRQIMRMDDGLTREKMIKNLKARMVLEGFDLQMQKQTWGYAMDKEMMVDSVLEQYDKLNQRKANSAEAIKNMEGQ